MTDESPTMSDLDNPQRWECTECSYAFYDTEGWEKWYCSECGHDMEKAPPEGYTPNDDLREVIERMRNIPSGSDWDTEQTGYQKASQNWADELEELIDDE